MICLLFDKHHFRSSLPSDEASMPPSKRRHRAQEAMSACVFTIFPLGNSLDVFDNVFILHFLSALYGMI